MTDYLKSMLGAIDVSLNKPDLRDSTRLHLNKIRQAAVAVLSEKAFYCKSCIFQTDDPHEAIDHKLSAHDNMSGLPGWFCRDCNFRTLTYDHVEDRQKHNFWHKVFRLNEKATPKPKEVSND